MIKNFYRTKKPVFSLEVFPPKKDSDISTIYNTVDQLKELSPDFISVTYGAGGSTSKKTVEIASYIQNTLGIEAVAHLTCVGLDDESLKLHLNELKEKKVKNIMALRGDVPKDMTLEEFEKRHFRYAADLVKQIKKHPLGSIGGGCYPETHPEAPSKDADIQFLKEKVDAGVDFLATQLFFDNSVFYDFMERARKAGITTPVSAGIMPITSASQIKHIVELSGSAVPSELSHIIALYSENPDDLKKACLEFATKQIEDLLANDVDGIHLYTMNKVDVAKTIYRNLGRI